VSPKKPQRDNTLWDIQMEITKDGRAPIAFPEKMAAFDQHKKILLANLLKVHKGKSETFDADKSWRDLTQLARLYFWGQDMEQNALPPRERIKRLHQLAKALRQAHGLTQRAIGDSVGDDLYRAWFAQKKISAISIIQIDEIDKDDGSSIVTRIADEIKEMAETLATLKTVSHAAATAADVLSKGGRPVLLPRDCIQGLTRVYRTRTGAKPGRGAGPFADFAAGFALAVGKTGFSRRSLIDAIQDAHLQFRPSWFDGKPPPS
jgi:hypothetical protein